MGVMNLKWRDAMAVAGWHFTKAEQDTGWPDSMKPDQLAALHRPYIRGGIEHRPGRWRTEAFMKAISDACESGNLAHETKVMPGKAVMNGRIQLSALRSWEGTTRTGTYHPSQKPKDVTTYTVTAPAFAAWLAAQPETPSAHIAAWFEAVGVKNKDEAPPVPNDETIEDRNDRWLAYYEAEEKAGRKYGAVIRGANHFQAERSLYGKALKDAKELRAEKYRADIKAVPAKGGAGGWGPSTLVEMGKKKKGTKT